MYYAPVMVNLGWQFSRNISSSWCKYEGIYKEVSLMREIHSKCESQHPVGWVPRINEKKKVSKAQSFSVVSSTTFL